MGPSFSEDINGFEGQIIKAPIVCRLLFEFAAAVYGNLWRAAIPAVRDKPGISKITQGY